MTLRQKICEAGVNTLRELMCKPCTGTGTGETVYVDKVKFVDIGNNVSGSVVTSSVSAGIDSQNVSASIEVGSVSANIEVDK